MADQFSWGIWLSTEVPYKGRAYGAMEEKVFRDLLRSILKVVDQDSDRALDRIKDIMVCELNKTAVKR